MLTLELQLIVKYKTVDSSCEKCMHTVYMHDHIPV